MPNQRRRLYIFNSNMQRKFITYSILFIIPVLLGYIAVEYLTRKLPMEYMNTAAYIENNGSDIEILLLGSSQMKNAVNPAWIKRPAINLASGNQHHNTDFKLFKALQPKLPKLQTVVLEVSYSHFELPHNAPDLWKNSVYLKFYGANCFERRTWFKDRLIYLSNPSFFSERLISHYIQGNTSFGFNRFGFDTLNFGGRFKKNNYNETKIARTNFKINTEPNQAIFRRNTTLFTEMLEHLSEKKLHVIIVNTPMYKTYLPKRNAEILYRRDSILKVIKTKFTNVSILNREEDTINFSIKDYWNQSHLNPNGAKVFTEMLQKEITNLL